MNIILELSTGKEIKLTMKEFEEIKGTKLEEVCIPYQRIGLPWYPYPTVIWGDTGSVIIAPTTTTCSTCSKGE